jgi:hypothetical protein
MNLVVAIVVIAGLFAWMLYGIGALTGISPYVTIPVGFTIGYYYWKYRIKVLDGSNDSE